MAYNKGEAGTQLHAARHEAERIGQGGGRLPTLSVDPNLSFEVEVPSRCMDALSSEEDNTPPSDKDFARGDSETLRAEKRRRIMWRKKTRKAPVPRAIVDEFHMVTLVKAYRTEFAEFCRGTKKAPKQMIPGKVWERIYRDHYLVLFPHFAFEEGTLKKHLREQLAELDTGIVDGGQSPLLQDEQIASEVRATDCAATRNILRMRQSFIGGVSTGGIAPSRTSASTHPTSAPATPAQPKRPADVPLVGTIPTVPTTPSGSTLSGGASTSVERVTKSEMLQKQAQAVCSIAMNFEASTAKQQSLMDTKNSKHKMDMLKEAKVIGVLSEDAYKAKIRELLDL